MLNDHKTNVSTDSSLKKSKKRKKADRRCLVGFLVMLLALIVAGISPVSEYINAQKRAETAKLIDTTVTETDTGKLDEILAQAQAFNARLGGYEPETKVDEIWPYERQLSPDGHTTAFGSIYIPKLDLIMPLYHGTSKEVLSAGAGHLEGTSLPVGGQSSHSVLSAHSGMSGMQAFDMIRNLEPGDIFGVKILGKFYAYEVFNSEVVEPDAVDKLSIIPNEDRCTLVTCTPYGVNTHRLLVTGRRTEVPDGYFEKTGDNAVISAVTNFRSWPLLAGFALFVLLLIPKKKKGKKAGIEKGKSGKISGPNEGRENVEKEEIEEKTGLAKEFRNQEKRQKCEN